MQGPSHQNPCRDCGRTPTFPIRYADTGHTAWLCETCDRLDERRGKARLRQVVPWVVEVLNEKGRFLQVTAVALVDEDSGRVAARYRDLPPVETLFAARRAGLRVVATEIVGRARTDLAGRWVCDAVGK